MCYYPVYYSVVVDLIYHVARITLIHNDSAEISITKWPWVVTHPPPSEKTQQTKLKYVFNLIVFEFQLKQWVY